MSELATAYVQLVPTATGMKDKIAKELGPEADAAAKSAGDSAGGALGSSLGSAFKKVVVALGLGKIVKDALDAGGALQQSFGGLDTLYGDAAKQAKVYASEAVKAGISANNYAEQAVSFGASLKQAFGGDTVKAMESANTAILDMADNSAKMGTDISSIQNAYQGFAKQNYTMLDNLKLGYGGTKTEMERLLADAEKLSGVKYDINNLGDVYSAIHVIQDELGLTGVAAAEAEGTFTGSFATMKAAAQNLLANLALGEDIKPSLDILQQSVITFLTNNLFPMVGNILKAAPDILAGLTDLLVNMLNMLTENAPQWITAGMELLTNLIQGLIEALPSIAEATIQLGAAIVEGLMNFDWLGAATQLINTLATTLSTSASEIFGTDGAGIVDSIVSGIMNTIGEMLEGANSIITELTTGITANLPTVLNSGIQILTKIVNGILQQLPQIIQSASKIINTLAQYIMTNLPTILKAGVEMLLTIVKAIITNLPQIIKATLELIQSLLTTIYKNLPQILKAGIELIGELIAGLWRATPDALSAMWDILREVSNTINEIDWLGLGWDIISGIAEGISNAGGKIWDAVKGACKSAWNNALSFWDIGSPSKLMENTIGRMIPQGMAVGIEEDADYVTKAMHDVAAESVEASQEVPYFGDVQPMTTSNSSSVTFNNVFNINGTDRDPRELAEEISYYLEADRQRVAGVWA
jgi:phage-related protein